MSSLEQTSWELVKQKLFSLPLDSRKKTQLKLFLKKSMAMQNGTDLVVYVPNLLVKEFLEKNGVDAIQSASSETFGHSCTVTIELLNNLNFANSKKKSSSQHSRNTSEGLYSVSPSKTLNPSATINNDEKLLKSDTTKTEKNNSVLPENTARISSLGSNETYFAKEKATQVRNGPVASDFYPIFANPETKINVEEQYTNKVSETPNLSYSANVLSLEEIKNNPFYKDHELKIDKKKNFDNFVEGPTNQALCQNGMLVALTPGESARNPFFVYGKTGLGKTHILFAIANAIHKNYPLKKVMYVSIEGMWKDYVAAIQDYNETKNSQIGLISKFKALYRSLDVLLIDDMQEFSRFKDSFSTEFISLMNDLGNNQQLVFAASVVPSEIKIDTRLKSRFQSGVVIKVEPPDTETRRRIILKKVEEMGMKFEKQSVEFMTGKFQTDVRTLEGYIKTIRALIEGQGHHLIDTVVTVDIVKMALKDVLAGYAKMITVDNIKEVVAEYFKITVHDIDSSARPANIARPRMIAMTLAKELTQQSYPNLGKNFGGKDHSTVMHARKTIMKLIETDHKVREDYENLKLLLTE